MTHIGTNDNEQWPIILFGLNTRCRLAINYLSDKLHFIRYHICNCLIYYDSECKFNFIEITKILYIIDIGNNNEINIFFYILKIVTNLDSTILESYTAYR